MYNKIDSKIGALGVDTSPCRFLIVEQDVLAGGSRCLSEGFDCNDSLCLHRGRSQENRESERVQRMIRGIESK